MVNHDFDALHTAMQAQVDQEFLPGVSTALFKGREVVDTFCYGFADKEAKSYLSKVQADFENKISQTRRDLENQEKILSHKEGTLDQKIEIIENDPDDNKILECASEAKADYIITYDQKHLIPIKEFEGIKIILPKDFLSEFTF